MAICFTPLPVRVICADGAILPIYWGVFHRLQKAFRSKETVGRAKENGTRRTLPLPDPFLFVWYRNRGLNPDERNSLPPRCKMGGGIEGPKETAGIQHFAVNINISVHKSARGF